MNTSRPIGEIHFGLSLASGEGRAECEIQFPEGKIVLFLIYNSVLRFPASPLMLAVYQKRDYHCHCGAAPGVVLLPDGQARPRVECSPLTVMFP